MRDPPGGKRSSQTGAIRAGPVSISDSVSVGSGSPASKDRLPFEFTFTEEWTDPASLDAHFETAHIRGALERFPELLAEELDLRRNALVA